MNTFTEPGSLAHKLDGKIENCVYWLTQVSSNIKTCSATGADLVCLQCELEEAVEIIVALCAQMKGGK